MNWERPRLSSLTLHQAYPVTTSTPGATTSICSIRTCALSSALPVCSVVLSEFAWSHIPRLSWNSGIDTSSFWVCSLFCCIAVGPTSTTWTSSFPAEGSCPSSSASASSLHFSVPGFLDSRLEPCFFCSCLPEVALWGAVLVCADFHK